MIKFKQKKAFSTPELLMTILVFSFGILPLIILFQNSHKQTAQAKNLMIAHSLGRTIISQIRALGFKTLSKEIKNSKLGIIHTDKQVEGPLVKEDDKSIVYPDCYKRFTTSVNLSTARVKNNKKIRVELDVKWKEQGRTFNLGFGTVVVKYDSES